MPSWLTAEAEKVRAQTRHVDNTPRYEQALALRGHGLSVPEIARRMGVRPGTAKGYLERGQARAAIREGAPEIGTEELTERMCAVYDDPVRQRWIRQQIALRQELVEHKRRKAAR